MHYSIYNKESKDMYYILPITSDPRQVFTLDLEIDGEPFHARMEIRYLPAPEIPLICSCGQVNDLFRPFRHLRDGRGLGSLFVIRDTDEPSTPDPAEGNLTAFRILFGRTIDE